MASSSQYGVTAPAGSDPYPIESTLSQLAFKENPVEAANMLDVYRSMNEANTGNYNYALNQQHQYAYDQLAATMAQEHAKNLLEANKTPGGLSLLQASNNASDIDPSLISGLETNLARAQGAETFNKAAGGAYSAVQAGFDPNAQRLAELTGGVTGPQGEALSTKNAIIAANAKIAAAKIHGPAAGNTQPVTYPIDTPGGPMHVPIDPTKPLQPQVDTWTAWGKQQYQVQGQAPQTPSPDVQPAAVSSKRPLPAGQVSGVPPTTTSLTPNTTNTRAGLPPGHSVLPTNTPEGKQAQLDAASALRLSQGTPLHDIIAPRGSGVFDLRKSADGRVYTKGRDGNNYEIKHQATAQ
jgi:hypothetical protein